MLTYAQRRDVEQAFAEELYLENPRRLIETIFQNEAYQILIGLRPNDTVPDIAASTLTSCLLSRWEHEPSLLEMLLQYLVTKKGYGDFDTILRQVRAHVDPNPDAYASSWLLNNSRPFFDRHDLRSHVRLLIEQNGWPILRVPADGKGYGRSYSLQYLEHLENCRPGDVHVLATSLSKRTAPSYQVEDLLAHISAQLGLTGPLPERTRSSYSESATLWLLQQLMSTRDMWALVLDGFGQRELHPEVRETIQNLAYQVTVGQNRRRIRLVLLDYPHPLPDDVSPADILTETIPPAADICRADLMPCLESWDRLRRQQGLVGIATGELDLLAEGMLNKAPLAGKNRLEALNAKLLRLLGVPGRGLSMARSDGLTAAEILAYLDNATPPQPPPGQVRAYREAAAVLAAVRDPERLRPVGVAPADAATALLGPDLIPATGRKFNGTVMLRPEIRAATISDLIASGRIEDALAANPDERDGMLQSHLERYLRGEGPPLSGQSLDELEATLQVSVWLSGIVEGVPPADDVEANAGYLRLLAPFEALAGDSIFRGRGQELDRLRRYIGVVAPESALERLRAKAARWIEPERQPAISISGIGGAGKSSLVARFMLEHTRLPQQERIPFGYLDFARVSLNIGNALELCRELLRQLSLQFPDPDHGFDSLSEFINRPEGLPGSSDARDLLSAMLRRLRTQLGARPYVVVLDTFEEVQYRGEERAYPFWDMLSELQDEQPFLRVVVSGRAPAESLRLAGRPPRRLELGDLDAEAARAFLTAQGIEDPQIRDLLIESFGRLPLSLKLVGSLAARTPGGAAALLDPATRGFSLLAASDEVIQAQLYGRILDTIPDERVRRLAHPGLTLRRINPALILEVLNEPCGLLISTADEATTLFEELRRQSSLVLVDNADGDLVHRPDLRQVMLKMLLNGAPAVVSEIHGRAAAWYDRQPGRRARAEYAYHLLHLENYAGLAWDRHIQDALNDREVRASIQAVIEEFPVEVQLWLATLGFNVPDTVREKASRDQAHESVAAQIEQLLPYGARSELAAERVFESAYQSLSDDRNVVQSVLGRVDRGASPVFRAGARVAAQRGDDEQALNLIERGLERAVRDGAADLTLGLLKERAWLYRRLPRAHQAEGLALLSQHARQHQDLAGQIQYEAQRFGSTTPEADDDVQAIGYLLGQASPQDLWNLVPALRLVLGPSPFRVTGTPIERLMRVLRDLVAHRESPFRFAVFPDPAAQVALDDLLASARETDLNTFHSGFVRLCDAWPYMILYVTAPQGRRGEHLTIE